MRLRLFSLAIVALLISCGGEKKGKSEKEKPSGEKVLLRFKPTKGAIYEIGFVSEINQPSIGDKTVSNLNVKLVIDSIADKRTWISAMFSHFDVTNTQVGVSFTFDSDKDTASSDPRIEGMFGPIIAIMNKKAGMLVDDQMKILKQPNFDSLVPKKYQMDINSLGLDQSFEEFFVVWPDAEISVGSTWDRQIELQQPQLSVKAVYKVTAIDKEFIHLKLTADISSEEEHDGIKTSVKGKIDGTAKVRRADGWMYASKTSLSLTFKSPGEEAKMNNSITIKTK